MKADSNGIQQPSLFKVTLACVSLLGVVFLSTPSSLAFKPVVVPTLKKPVSAEATPLLFTQGRQTTTSLRDEVKKNGLTILIDQPLPASNHDLDQLRELYGQDEAKIQVRFASEPQMQNRQSVLKIHELDQAGPSGVPLIDLIKGSAFAKRFANLQAAALQIVQEYLKVPKKAMSREKQAVLEKLIAETFDYLAGQYPMGFTLETPQHRPVTITSSTHTLTREFLSTIDQAKTAYLVSALSFQDADFQRVLAPSGFLNSLLIDPMPIRAVIAREENSYQVTFVDGQPVQAQPRLSFAYNPEKEALAKQAVNAYFKQNPHDPNRLIGSAEISFDPSGNAHIHAFNQPEDINRFLAPEKPLQFNYLLSRILGHTTRPLNRLEGKFNAALQSHSVSPLIRYLNEAWSMDEYVYGAHQLRDDFSADEAFLFFRDHYLQHFAASKSAQSARETLQQLRSLYEGLKDQDNRELKQIYLASEKYLQSFQ